MDEQEVISRLKETAAVFRNAEPTRTFGDTRLYEMTEEIRDAIVELIEQAAALIGDAYEDAE
jgi:hypothetical protein